MARLGDIFTITSGGTPDKKKSEYYANGTIPWVKTGDLKNQYVPTGIECITEEGLKNSSVKLFPPNTVLVAMYGATIGACSILPYEASTNQACAAFLPNEKVMPTYLYYFLSSKKEQFIKDGVGGAQPNISAGYLKNVQFDLIPMQQQINMVSTLDKVSELIALRKEQLAKLEQLVKSRFIELFGDPVANEKGWPLATLGEVAEIRIGPFGTLLHKEDYIEGGHALVNPSHIIEGSICVDDKLTISDEKYKELSAYHLLVGDVVLGRRGEMGRCAVVYKEGLLCGTGSMVIRPSDKMKPYFLQNIISNPAYKKVIEDKAVGVTMMNLNVPIVSSLTIPLLPVEMQEKFIVFMQKTDKSKLAVQQSLDKLETLKKALMQKYFG